MERTSSDAGTPRAPSHPDPLALLRTLEQAAIEREGVAMFVGIHDARPSTRERSAADGRAGAGAPDPEADRLRILYEEYAAGLAPGREERRPTPDPTGGAWPLVEVLLVLSQHHLRAPVARARPGPQA